MDCCAKAPGHDRGQQLIYPGGDHEPQQSWFAFRFPGIGGGNIASLAVSPALYRNLRYDAERDFTPVGMIASNPNALSVHSGLPATTIAEFIALAKSRPGQLNYASAGVGTSPQLSMD
jgi:hypothetical protein